MDKLELKVKNYIKDKKLNTNNKPIVLAFSYGVDSRVLLEILINLGYKVVLAHVNHGVRAESKCEEIEAIKLAKELNISIYVKHLNLDKSNFEDTARKERYKFFKEICDKENTNVLALAHHLDDNLETILLKLTQGSNIYGYSGIHPQVFKNSLEIIRPLMCTTKDEIRAYQMRNSLLYFEDYTNKENIQMRNKIRNNVIPLLKDIDSNILYKTNEYSSILEDAFNHIRGESINYLERHNKEIEISSFKGLDTALRKDIICFLLEEYHINRSNKLINLIDTNLLNNKSNLEITLSNDFFFFKSYNRAFISKKKNQDINEITLDINERKEFGDYIFYFSKSCPNNVKNYIKLCYNTINLPLSLRTRENGDRIKLPGGSKKVKDLFIDKKIDISLRDKLPLVISNDNIIWIPNVAKSSLISSCLDNWDLYLIMEVKNA